MKQVELSEKADILKKSYIFSGLDSEDIDVLARLCVEKEYEPDEFIFWEGDAPEWFYIVVRGQVKVLKHASSGKQFIIAFFRETEIFGDVAVFEDKPYPASARAVDSAVVLGIKRQEFTSFLRTRPEVALRIISILSARLREAQDRLGDFAGERIEQRLAFVLCMLAGKLGPVLPFTRREIADMAGTTTETVIRVLSAFGKQGIIRSVRGKITILDEPELRSLSGRP